MQTGKDIRSPYYFFLFCCYFLVFLIACRWIFRVGHLQISCCDKGGDVFGYIFCMIDNTSSFQNFPTVLGTLQKFTISFSLFVNVSLLVYKSASECLSPVYKSVSECLSPVSKSVSECLSQVSKSLTWLLLSWTSLPTWLLFSSTWLLFCL